MVDFQGVFIFSKRYIEKVGYTLPMTCVGNQDVWRLGVLSLNLLYDSLKVSGGGHVGLMGR